MEEAIKKLLAETEQHITELNNQIENAHQIARKATDYFQANRSPTVREITLEKVEIQSKIIENAKNTRYELLKLTSILTRILKTHQTVYSLSRSKVTSSLCESIPHITDEMIGRICNKLHRHIESIVDDELMHLLNDLCKEEL